MNIRRQKNLSLPLSSAVCLAHMRKYSQYAQNKGWTRWYAHVAPLKAQRVAQVLRRYKGTDSTLLDLGCGTGMTFATLAQTFSNATALDIGETEVRATKELLAALKTKATVKKYNGKTIPFASETFDIVTSIEVIEHVDNPIQMLSEMRRVLKKDGILHITTANKWWPIEPHFHLPFLSYLPPPLADRYVRITGRGTSYHDIHLPSYGQFKRMVEQFFTVDDITLDIIRDFKAYGLDKERGNFIRALGSFLSYVERMKKYSPSRPLAKLVSFFLCNVSLGWLFMGHPKNGV